MADADYYDDDFGGLPSRDDAPSGWPLALELACVATALLALGLLGLALKGWMLNR